MSSASKEIYSRFLNKNSIFSSVDEILYYKSLWPAKQFVQQKVENALPLIQVKKYHMGLDISSRSTGLCILDSQKHVIAYKAIHPDASCKGNSILSASQIYQSIQSTMKSIDGKIQPENWNIVIEKYLQMFGTASFRTQSLFYLAEINGIIQYKCWEDIHSMPMTIHPSTARSYLGIQSAGSREETKNSVFEVVREKTADEIEWTEKKRGKGYADECFDIADAYVLANAGYIENQIESILQYYKIDDGEKDSVAKSSFLIDFIKIHIVHYIRKFLDDDSLQTVESLPKSFVDKYCVKIRDMVTDVLKGN